MGALSQKLVETWRTHRTVYLSVLGVSWFWFYGALLLVPLGGPGRETLFAAFFLGLGAGSLLARWLSRGKFELGLVPLGSIGLTVFAADLAWATSHQPAAPGVTRVAIDLALAGLFGGLFVVPLYAFIQERSAPPLRSRRRLATYGSNVLFAVVAAGVAFILRGLDVSVPTLFVVAAILNALVATYIYTLLPEFLMRFLVWLLVHTIYRLDERGLENIPEEGPAVLVCNHVSFVDPLLLAAACHRPARFVMDHRIFAIPVLNFVFRAGRAIPIAPAKEDPALMARALEEVAKALAEGELVCIFPEGKITKDGELNVFRPGIEHIIERTPVPVIPVALQGLWGSFFSRKGGSAMRKPFRRVWSKVGVVVGEAWPARTVSASGLEAKVLALRGERR